MRVHVQLSCVFNGLCLFVGCEHEHMLTPVSITVANGDLSYLNVWLVVLYVILDKCTVHSAIFLNRLIMPLY